MSAIKYQKASDFSRFDNSGLTFISYFLNGWTWIYISLKSATEQYALWRTQKTIYQFHYQAKKELLNRCIISDISHELVYLH